jgi:hypothetical protein
MPAMSSGEQRDVGGGKETGVAENTQSHIASVVHCPPGDRNVSRVGLEFSYSTGVAAPWGGRSEVALHWKGPEKDPICCLRSIGISRSRKSQ